MQTDSPLKIVTSIIANVQIGPITNQVKIPVTEKGYIQMIIGIPQLQNCIIDIPKKQITCKGKIIYLKSIYNLPKIINNNIKKQTKKKAIKTRRETIQGYQLPDGSTMTEKENFIGWIRQIFDAPLQIRTGKYSWENKALPDLPKQERESIHQYIPEITQPMILTP